VGFEEAVEKVLKHEGGYVNHPSDPGGETKYGISKRSYPYLDIQSLTVEDAKEIYRRDWWDKYGYGTLMGNIGEKLFDFAINMGAESAHRLLQRAINHLGQKIVVEVDGIIGLKTRTAMMFCRKIALMDALRLEAIRYYTYLAKRKSMRVFLLGWIKRALD